MQIRSLDHLRRFVQCAICERERLLPGAFHFDEHILERHSQTCGLHFTLNGPRAVSYSAIWDAFRGTILFYGCNGERTRKVQLTTSSALHVELLNSAAADSRSRPVTADSPA